MSDTAHKIIALPNSKETEMMVLGCMLSMSHAFSTAATSLDMLDFYFKEHQIIFQILKKLFREERPADVHLIAEELKKNSHLQTVGGVVYLTSLAQYAGLSSNIEEYIEIVKNKSFNRKALQLLDQARETFLKDPTNPSEAAEGHYQRLVELGKTYSPNDKASIGDILVGSKSRVDPTPLIQRLEERQNFAKEHNKPFITGIPTGFLDLDNQVTILENTNMIILAARPAMGKTALALNIAAHVCFDQNFPVAIISLEMGADQIVERFLSMKSGVSGEALKRGTFSDKDLKKLREEEAKLRNGKLFIYDHNCASVSQVVSRARRLKDEEDIRLLIVDYLQLLGTDGGADSRQYEIAEVSRKLKLLAMELKIPILCVAQLSRKVEERTDKRPLMSDLKDSGQLEQDADAVLFIYRDEYYKPNGGDRGGCAEVYLGKNRHGPTPSVSLHFDKNCGSFNNYIADKSPITGITF